MLDNLQKAVLSCGVEYARSSAGPPRFHLTSTLAMLKQALGITSRRPGT